MSPSVAAGAFPELDDPNPSNNTSSASLTVNPQADVSLTKTVSNPNPGTDDEVVYTLTASNAGPNDATGVTITDSLPAGLDFLDASPGCDNNNGTVTCDARHDRERRQRIGDDRGADDGGRRWGLRDERRDRLRQRARPEPGQQPGDRIDQRQAARRPRADEGRFESLGERGWPGQLHADLGQQRAEPRNWGHDHRPASQAS